MCALVAIENIDIRNGTLTLVPMFVFTAWIRKNFCFTIPLGCTLEYPLHIRTHYFKTHFNIIVPFYVYVFPVVSYLQVLQVNFFKFFIYAYLSHIVKHINFRIHIFKLDTSYVSSCKWRGFISVAMWRGIVEGHWQFTCVLCLSQPSITLLSVFIYIRMHKMYIYHQLLWPVLEVSEPYFAPLQIWDCLNGLFH
jgi:hypothetical protein